MEITVTGGSGASGNVDFSFSGLGVALSKSITDFPTYSGPGGDFTTHGFNFDDPDLTAITLPGGVSSSKILYDGNDTVQLGSGAATINAASNAASDQVLILGSHATPTTTGFGGFSLLFGNGAGASTVTSGSGNYLIYGGAGGGVFYGGKGNGNVIAAGTAAATIFGGGGGTFSDGQVDSGSGGKDVITSGTGASTTYALGSDTLIGSNTLTGGATGDAFETGASTVPGAVDIGTIFLGAGVDTIVVTGAQSEDVVSSSHSKGLLFWGGSTASTVSGYDGGSVTVSAGTGGGVYSGGTGTGNFLAGDAAAGAAAVTLYGGGGNDLMIGGQAAGNLFVSSNGNETLIGGGQGGDTFNFQNDAYSPGGHATVASTYTVLRYTDTDNLVFNAGQIKSQGQSGASYTINLVDGSKVVLLGVAEPGRTFT